MRKSINILYQNLSYKIDICFNAYSLTIVLETSLHALVT